MQHRQNLIATPRQQLIINPARTWFTGDTHIAHANIIRLCNRPFSTCEEMDHAILNSLHDAVRPGDTLIHLGDVSLHKQRTVLIQPGRDIFRVLVRGNHDLRSNSIPGWDIIVDYLELHESQKGGPLIVLSHYPFAEWNGYYRGSIHLHGHTHNTVPPIATPLGGRLDVGVDAWDFRPVRLSHIRARLARISHQGG